MLTKISIARRNLEIWFSRSELLGFLFLSNAVLLVVSAVVRSQLPTVSSNNIMSCGQSEFLTLPDVCANDEESREMHLLAHETDDSANVFERTVKRDKPLLIAIAVMVVLLHIPYFKFILYPFMIFSTWVHEMCHGLAAILVGGGIKKLFVYRNGSGLAYTWTNGKDWKRAFVASAGYTGTALLGGFLLLWRRTRRGPTAGMITIGCTMLLSCMFFVRNVFGIAAITVMGIAIILCGWKLKAEYVGYLYSFLAATCSFNAIDSIQDLFDIGYGESYVNGEARSSDAHTVAEIWALPYQFWAVCWLVFALVMSAIGLVFAFDGKTYKQEQKQRQLQPNQQTQVYTPQVPVIVY
jgi:hypothetical protein